MVTDKVKGFTDKQLINYCLTNNIPYEVAYIPEFDYDTNKDIPVDYFSIYVWDDGFYGVAFEFDKENAPWTEYIPICKD